MDYDNKETFNPSLIFSEISLACFPSNFEKLKAEAKNYKNVVFNTPEFK